MSSRQLGIGLFPTQILVIQLVWVDAVIVGESPSTFTTTIPLLTIAETIFYSLFRPTKKALFFASSQIFLQIYKIQRLTWILSPNLTNRPIFADGDDRIGDGCFLTA